MGEAPRPEAQVRVRVLGPVAVDNGHPDEPFGPRLRRLVAALALGWGSTVSEQSLLEAVWPSDDDLPEQPARSLQVHVSRLRRHLGAVGVERVAPGYRLVPEHVEVDAAVFEHLLTVADRARRQADDRRAVETLEDALGLWCGPALFDFADEAWARPEATRLDELRLDAQEQRAELLIGLGDAGGALVAELEHLAGEHPHRERPTRLLMLALYQGGRQADALTAFARHRRQLATDLGLEPSPELQQLETRILTDDPTVSAAANSRSLLGYEILERLGEGAFSIVYRGVQPSVGREVAIKQIRAELANRPEFIRRFETEARLVARLEHPHIVPLIDYWREPGSAYLVMRLLRGGSLETSALEKPWSLDRTVRMVDQVGSALAAAHREGVVHRDVKSANILLDEEGNAYLTDFGIALEAAEAADPMAALSAGSPAYASPEQLRHEPVGPSADVHGLAIATFEALTGRLPFPDEPNRAALLQRQLNDPIPLVRSTRTDLPRAVDGVLQDATTKDPAERMQTVEEFVAALHQAFEGATPTTSYRGATTAVTAEARNPYKGLRPFDEADAADFTGRERLVDQLVDELGRHRLVAVVGPSGSGKSSVVRAGLIPELRRGRLPRSGDWFTALMLPGRHPFEELEDALTRIAADTPSNMAELLTSERGIGRSVKRLLPDRAELVLVIDQFEELFTLCEDDTELRAFVDGLAAAVTGERSQLRVVLTLRADFYDRPLSYESIGRLVRDATVPVLPLAADELERAIVDPAQRVGCEFEPGLVSRIVADVADQPAALPMLQYALTELWEQRTSDLLTRRAYDELGGVSGALARRAEALYEEGTHPEQTAARALFGRLATPRETGEATRRRALRSEVVRAPGAQEVIERYGAARLLSFDRDPATREPTVEVAHEALLRHWPRLQAWLDEDRDAIRIQRHLANAAEEWIRRGRPDGELYRGGRLDDAVQWATEVQADAGDLAEGEAEFLTASENRRAAEQEAERRTTRRLQRLLTAVGIVAVVAVAAGALALWQQRRADEQAARADEQAALAAAGQAIAEAEQARAETRRIANQAALVAVQQRDLGLLLAVEAYRREPTPTSLGALQQALIDVGPFLGLVGGNRRFQATSWLDDRIVLGVGPEGITSVDTVDHTTIDLVSEAVHTRDNRNSSYDEQPLAVYTVDGSTVAFVPTADPSSIELVSLESGSGSGSVSLASGSSRSSVSLDSAPLEWLALEGDLLAAIDREGTLFLVDVGTGSVRWSAEAVPEETFGDYELPEGYTVFPTLPGQQVHTWAIPIVFSADGGAVEVHGTTLRSYDVVTGERTETFLGSQFAPDGPRFAPLPYQAIAAPDGARLLTRSSTFVNVLDRASLDYTSATRVEATANTVRGALMEWLWWDGGETAATLLSDGRIAQFTVADGLSSAPPIDTRLIEAHHLSVSPDGRTAAVASRDGIALFALDGRRAMARSLPTGGTYGATISVDGRLLAQGYPNLIGNDPRRDQILDADVGEPVPSPADLPRFRFPTGIDVVVGDNGEIPNRIVVFDPQTLDPVAEVELETSGTIDLALSHDLRFLVVTTWFEGVSVVSLDSGQVIARLDQVGDQAQSPTFSPDGSRLAILDRDGRPTVWDTSEWSVVADGFPRLDETIVALRYRPAGNQLATLDRVGTVTLRDAETHEVIRTFATTSRLSNPDGALAFDQHGRLLLVLAGPSITLWDIDTGLQIGKPFPNDATNVAAIQDGADHPQLVTAEGDARLIWDLDVDGWADLACALAGRNLTEAEWAQFGPATDPYRPTCPRWPTGTGA